MPFWAVARINPGFDRLAAESVAAARFETFVPRIRTQIGSKWRTVPLFGCYFFVRVIDQWRILERSPGVAAVVKFGATPARCPDEEIAQLLARADPDGIIRLNRSPIASGHVFEPGAPVMIAGGPFRGLAGIYGGQTAHERELILLDVLGRATPVDVAAGLVVPAR
jgi:transcription antitermination factor NusG